MATLPLQGIVPAVATPFRPDETIDYSAWQELLEFLIAAKVHGLFVIGGQGEFFSLSEEERTVAARFCVQTVAQRVPVFANVGAVTTAETVRLAQSAESDKVDYLVVVTPYYIQPSGDDLFEHYSEVCRSVRIPVLAYNIPQCTGVALSAALLRRIAEANENFVGLKDSSGKLNLIPECKRAGLSVFMGQDNRILDGLRMGCVGAVTACSNVAPRLFVDLYDAYQAGKLEEAVRLQALIDLLAEAASLAFYTSVIKDLMNMAGLKVGRCRRPVGPVPEPSRKKLAAVIEKLREANYVPALTDLGHAHQSSGA
jgi:4-hydroxy-tetrahydrodipicolinate synthase